MTERLNVLVSKTSVDSGPPWVRIPLSPPFMSSSDPRVTRLWLGPGNGDFVNPPGPGGSNGSMVFMCRVLAFPHERSLFSRHLPVALIPGVKEILQCLNMLRCMTGNQFFGGLTGFQQIMCVLLQRI